MNVYKPNLDKEIIFVKLKVQECSKKYKNKNIETIRNNVKNKNFQHILFIC